MADFDIYDQIFQCFSSMLNDQHLMCKLSKSPDLYEVIVFLVNIGSIKQYYVCF